MVISNSKYGYDKNAKSVKNRGYLSGFSVDAFDSVHDEDEFEIPRYEELRYIRLEDTEEWILPV